MQMTKQHFKAIGEILRNHSASEELAKEMGRYLARQNENFNILKFLEVSLGIDLTS